MEGQRVLAIACDWRLRKLIRANLEAVGLEVFEAVTGRQGITMLDGCPADLVLLDLESPEVDASHFLGAFDQQFPGCSVPVVGMSTEPPDRRLMVGEVVVSHLRKPFAATRLLDHVRRALGSGVR
jgi:DNA-binding NtrC family response regulator